MITDDRDNVDRNVSSLVPIQQVSEAMIGLGHHNEHASPSVLETQAQIGRESGEIRINSSPHIGEVGRGSFEPRSHAEQICLRIGELIILDDVAIDPYDGGARRVHYSRSVLTLKCHEINQLSDSALTLLIDTALDLR